MTQLSMINVAVFLLLVTPAPCAAWLPTLQSLSSFESHFHPLPTFPPLHNLQSFAAPIVSNTSERSKSCAPGFTLVGKECIKTETFEAESVCPHSTEAVNGVCLSFAQTIRTCPSGYSPRGDICAKIAPAVPVCDDGSEVQGGTCRSIKKVAPMCSSGFHLEGVMCVKYAARQPTCPDGYRLQDKSCVRVDHVKAAAACQPGYEMDGNACTMKVDVAARCDTGFRFVRGECVKEVAKVYADCPAGSEAGETACYVSVQQQCVDIDEQLLKSNNNLQGFECARLTFLYLCFSSMFKLLFYKQELVAIRVLTPLSLFILF